MSRTIPAPLLASTTAAQLNPFFATSLDFDAGTVRYWTGYGTITINSATYAGIGAFSSISTIEETEDLSARGLTIDLTGVPDDLVAAALTEPYQGRTAAVRFGTLNADTGAVIDSITIFSGRMDTMVISNDGKQATIGIAVESRDQPVYAQSIRKEQAEPEAGAHLRWKFLAFPAYPFTHRLAETLYLRRGQAAIAVAVEKPPPQGHAFGCGPAGTRLAALGDELVEGRSQRRGLTLRPGGQCGQQHQRQ